MHLLGQEGDHHHPAILVDIIGATNLPIADFKSTDAYVVVFVGNEEIHRTGVVCNKLDPIWTIRHGSLFVIPHDREETNNNVDKKVNDEDNEDVVMFSIQDKDVLGQDDLVGTAVLPWKDLIKGSGERVGLPVKSHIGQPQHSTSNNMARKNSDHATLFVRFRAATEYDLRFFDSYRENPSASGIYAQEAYLPVRPPINGRFQPPVTGTNNDKLHRVRPFLDPDRPEEETEWMTKEEIHAECLKPSTKWVEAGSGRLGKCFVEILQVQDLPDKDTLSLSHHDATDAFACLVFEDSIVNTDVIADSLSPCWMPWCRRAFVFHVSHPASDLFVGVFDYDPEKSAVQLASQVAGFGIHDPIGRVRINLSKLVPNTQYDVTYPLLSSSSQTSSDNNETSKTTSSLGTIRMRIQLDFANNHRNAMLAGLTPTPMLYVAVPTKVDFDCASFTVEDPSNQEAFSLGACTRYLEELKRYIGVTEYIKEAIISVWLWRGNYEVIMCRKSILLPLHSLIAYFWGILVTWDFNYLPSLLIFSVGWAMLACNEQVRRNPSRWSKCRRYGPLVLRLLFNKVIPESICANDNIEQIEKFNSETTKSRQERQQKTEIEAARAKLLQEEFEDDIEEAKAERIDITERKEGMTLNPLKPVLYPLQMGLQNVALSARAVRNVILWEETFLAFWITTICFSLSALTMFIPWALIIRWCSRVSVWILLGPWMAIIDKCYFRRASVDSDKATEQVQSKYEQVVQAAVQSRITRERALKQQGMIRLMFGDFLFCVPNVKNEAWRHIPLATSSSRSAARKRLDDVCIEVRTFGQSLEDDLVPRREIQSYDARGSDKRTPKQFSLLRKRELPIWASKRSFLLRSDDENYQSERMLLLQSDDRQYQSVAV